jgi:hypothetical protein
MALGILAIALNPEIQSKLSDPTFWSDVAKYLGSPSERTPSCLAIRPPVTKYKTIINYGSYSYQTTIPYDNDSDPDESGAAELAEGETKTVYVTGSYPIITYKRVLKSPADPIILDLTGNGIQTVGLNAGIQFDINGSGVNQNTGWIGAANDAVFEIRGAG